MLKIIGGGLAGCEAAWQAASRGVPVTLSEMRPAHGTPAHRTADLAELVCSNSFRSDKLDNAVGLLKAEMRRLDSLVLRVAESVRVPAGAALAVDRELFARGMTQALSAHPLVTVVREEITAIPDGTEDAPVVIATGPLTSPSLSAEIARLVGAAHLYFYDAVSPIVRAGTIDMSRTFRGSRWNRSTARPEAATGESGVPQAGVGEGDYLNCPLDPEEYGRFYEALIGAERVAVHDVDRETFFEGCLPVEVMAGRGRDALRFGPMKPVGLVDPRTGRPPYAVVQLRQDTLAADHYSLVGFQTRLTWGEQARVLHLVPGLERAEFARFGMMHRNTYINGPAVLDATWQMRARPALFVAGQISGVEGYVESAASGLMAGRNAAALSAGRPLRVAPRTTAIGALAYYVSHAALAGYQPTNITFGIMDPLASPPRRRLVRAQALAARALADLDGWIAQDEAVAAAVPREHPGAGEAWPGQTGPR